jgi:hypothetical protein
MTPKETAQPTEKDCLTMGIEVAFTALDPYPGAGLIPSRS